jgi:transposase
MNENDISKVERFRQFKKEIRGSERYLVVGIDIAKNKHHAFLGTAIGKTVFRRLIVENSASGFEHLLAQVQFYMTRDGLDRVVFGLEPTGVYHKPLAEFLVEQGYLVVYVTNEAIKKNRALLDGRWDKNDTKDAANIADLVSRGKCHYYDLPQMGLRDIRSLLLLRKRLKKQEHGIKTRIRNNLVAQYFPELDSYWSRSEQESLSIVRWCLAPEKINELQFKDFFQMVTTRDRGHRQYQRLSKIWEMAPYSIGCKAGSALALEAKIMVEGLYAIRAQIAEIDSRIKELCKGFFEYDLLLSIPGFGPYVSAAVLAAIGNPYRFENAKQVLRLAGLDLNANRSGQKSANAVPVISRKGKAELRYALYQAALIASSANTTFTAYFTKLLRGRERERGIRTKMRGTRYQNKDACKDCSKASHHCLDIDEKRRRILS